MSRELRRIVLLLAVVVGGGLSGCKADKEQCESQTACSQSVQTCCSADSCKYVVAGRTFNCSGTNCDSAATQAVNAACGRGASPEERLSLIRNANVLAAQAAGETRP
jgi:hypothetical protein